jgi:hypothetical protein
MTTEQKLDKCIEFIRAVERGEFQFEAPAEDGDFTCNECGSDDVSGSVSVGVPDELRDKAWHVLADIA